MRRLITFCIILSFCFLAVVLPIFFLSIVSPPRSGLSLAWLNSDASMYEPDPELGSRLKPNLKVQIPGPLGSYSVITGPLGQRLDDLAGKSEDARSLILYVGGSQSFGSGLNGNETSAGVLNHMGSYKVENFSVPGFGGVPSLMMAERHLNKNPAYVIYGLWEDHFRRNVSKCAQINAPVCFSFPRLLLDNTTWSIEIPTDPAGQMQLVRKFYYETATDKPHYSTFDDFNWTLRKVMLQAEKLFTDENLVDDRAAQIDAMLWILKQSAQRIHEHGAELIVVYIPIYFGNIEPMPQKFSQRLSELKIKYIDMSARLVSLAAQGIDFKIQGDGHLNALGHRIIAEAILKELKAH